MTFRRGFITIVTIGMFAHASGAVAQTAPNESARLFVTGALRPPGADRNPACHVAREYVEFTNAGQPDKIGQLFADNAIYFGAREDAVEGAEKIRTFYAGLLSRAKPHIQITSLVPAGPHDCYLGLQGTTVNSGQKPLAAIDQFTLDAVGKISRLYTYYRPETFKALNAAATAPPSKN